MNGSKKSAAYLVIIAALVTAAAVFIYFIIQGRGVLTVRDDFNMQQIPFTACLHDAVKEGGLFGFNWSVDLGGSTLLSFGFYELGSIFFWLSMLVPTDLLPYAMAPLYILKYIAATGAAYLYISHFVKNRSYALVGALLYAFSGFQAVNLMFYHFHEAVAFFPLLLLGLELMMEESLDPVLQSAKTSSPAGKKGAVIPGPGRGFLIFTFMVFLNCITNYFFFIQEVVFLVIYFLCRFVPVILKTGADGHFSSDDRTEGKAGTLDARTVKTASVLIIKCIAAGILGVCMAGLIFIPSVIYILQGDRASEFVGLSGLWHDTKSFLAVLGGCLLPADPMNDGCIIYHENWKSMNCFLPLLGISPLIVYISKKRDWLSKLLVACIIFSMSPLLSSAFTMLTEYYVRWWYMFVMMMALAGAMILEEVQPSSGASKGSTSKLKEADLARGALACIVVTIVFYLLLKYFKWSNDIPAPETVFNGKRFQIYTLIGVLGAVCTIILIKLKKEGLWILSAVAFCTISTFCTLYFYKVDAVSGEGYINDYNTARMIADSRENFSDQYRVDLNNNNMYTMAAHTASLASFISTRSPGVAEFEDLFDYFSTNNGIDKGEIRGLTQLLAGRYEISLEEKDDAAVASAKSGSRSIYFYDDKNACPIGFCMEKYIFKSDLKNIAREDRAIALLQAAVVEDGTSLPGNMIRVTPGELNLQAETDYFVERYGNSCVKDFHRSVKGFDCTSNFEDERYVYFTVPYDEGWKCFIDGAGAPIIDSGGMMLLQIPGGEHSIVFKYSTPYLGLGAMACAAGWLIFAVLLFFEISKRKMLFTGDDPANDSGTNIPSGRGVSKAEGKNGSAKNDHR